MKIAALIAFLLVAVVAAAPASAANAGRTEIERIVVSGTAKDQETLKDWLKKNDSDRGKVEAELLASGFRKEPSRGDCFRYAYSGKDRGTRDDRSASATFCKGKLVWVAIWTWLPVDKNPKGPLPVIKPATGSAN